MSQAARASDVTVRKAAWSDAGALAATLARAFHDDPVTVHLLPDAAARARALPRMFKLLFKLGLPHGACHVTSGYEAATLWRPPDGWHVKFWDYVANAPELLGVFGGGVFNVMATMDRIEKLHPHAPHWYLQTIGTDPALQGKGYGGLILRHQLAVADAAGTPCYLESSKDTNLPIYQSFGFEITGEIKIPNGPTLWPMWREARR
ncbi:MAG TPA: GNAT family N-acetyltransferase [Rhizomicrobium sp.]|jgi:GNAT superfamily N-acetyltransferase|nr:GNAT family N-acetyltransferase [Rhizomicrobium sp.]